MYSPPKVAGVLSGLGGKSSVAAAAKGQAMQAAAQRGLDRTQQDQKMAVDQMQQQSQQRQQQAQNYARGAANDSQFRTEVGNMRTRRQAFDIGMAFDYAALRNRQQMNLKQALLNNFAREF